MKKLILCLTVFLVGSAVSFAEEKDPQTLGPVKVEDTVTNSGEAVTFDRRTYALQDQYILAVYTCTDGSKSDGDIRFELLKAGKDQASTKKDVSQIKADSQFLPAGSTTPWDANDLRNGGNAIRIVGFKSKKVIIRYTFADNSTRCYSYVLKTNGADVKVLGSTDNINNYNDSISDGKSTWIESDADGNNQNELREYTNKLEGTFEKPKTAKTKYELTAQQVADGATIVLPQAINKYNYVKVQNIPNGDGTTYDEITIHK